MQFYNSLTKKIEKFLNKGSVTIYSCGPTVYDYAHIGNFRTFLFEDLLIRTLKNSGYTVSHTRNITDVDDKTIQRSQEQHTSLEEFTTKYTEAFVTDLENLNFDQSSTIYLKATDYVTQMIDLIQELIQQDHAYETEDGVYFKISSFKEYGNFASLDLENLKQDTSEDNCEFNKEDLGDFVLWKKYKEQDGEVSWESPWGLGRPGWHTECAAMVNYQYPQGVDIHTGGIDLLFPHHTNEKAHSECLHHNPMASFWLHATHLLVDNKKMSKSLGNFYTVRDLVQKGFDYKIIRFYLQTEAHYRSPLNFTLERLKGAETALKRIDNFICEITENPHSTSSYTLKEITEKLYPYTLKEIEERIYSNITKSPYTLNKIKETIFKEIKELIPSHTPDKSLETLSEVIYFRILKKISTKIKKLFSPRIPKEIKELISSYILKKTKELIPSSILKKTMNTIYFLIINEIKTNTHTVTYSPLKEKFDSYLHNDLNISSAIRKIFTLINDHYYYGEKIDTANTLTDSEKINIILEVLVFSKGNTLNKIPEIVKYFILDTILKETLANILNEITENPHTTTPHTLKEKFDFYLHNDLNISSAMGEIFTLINLYYNGEKIDTVSTLADLKKINTILGVLTFPEENILNEITQQLYNLRVTARQEKNWAEADRLREELLTYGIEVRDNKEGMTVRKI